MKKGNKGSVGILNLIRSTFVLVSLLFTSSVSKIESKNPDVLGVQLAATCFGCYCKPSKSTKTACPCGCTPSAGGGYCTHCPTPAPAPSPTPNPTPNPIPPSSGSCITSGNSCSSGSCCSGLICVLIPYGKVCTTKASNPCNKGPQYCASGGTKSFIYKCDSSTGYYSPVKRCDFGCSGNSCKSGGCTSGTHSCTSDGMYSKSCGSDGVNWTTSYCAFGCNASGTCNGGAIPTSCKDGQVWDDVRDECVPISDPDSGMPSSNLPTHKSCDENKVWDDVKGECVAEVVSSNIIPVLKSPFVCSTSSDCGVGFVCLLTPYGKTCAPGPANPLDPCAGKSVYCGAYGSKSAVYACDKATGYYTPTRRCDFGCSGNSCKSGGCTQGLNVCASGDTIRTCSSDSMNWETKYCQYGCNNSTNTCNTASITSGSVSPTTVSTGSDCSYNGGSCVLFDDICSVEYGQSDCSPGYKCGLGCTGKGTYTPSIRVCDNGQLWDIVQGKCVEPSSGENVIQNAPVPPEAIQSLVIASTVPSILPIVSHLAPDKIPLSTNYKIVLENIVTKDTARFISMGGGTNTIPIKLEQGADTRVMSWLTDATNDAGSWAKITSGYRSAATQAAIKSTCTSDASCADSGYSQHATGLAVDITSNVPYSKLVEVANEHGIVQPFKSDPNHFFCLDCAVPGLTAAMKAANLNVNDISTINAVLKEVETINNLGKTSL